MKKQIHERKRFISYPSERPYRNEMKTPKKWLGLRTHIPFSTESNRLWRQDKGKGVYASRTVASCGRSMYGGNQWKTRVLVKACCADHVSVARWSLLLLTFSSWHKPGTSSPKFRDLLLGGKEVREPFPHLPFPKFL